MKLKWRQDNCEVIFLVHFRSNNYASFSIRLNGYSWNDKYKNGMKKHIAECPMSIRIDGTTTRSRNKFSGSGQRLHFVTWSQCTVHCTMNKIWLRFPDKILKPSNSIVLFIQKIWSNFLCIIHRARGVLSRCSHVFNAHAITNARSGGLSWCSTFSAIQYLNGVLALAFSYRPSTLNGMNPMETEHSCVPFLFFFESHNSFINESDLWVCFWCPLHSTSNWLMLTVLNARTVRNCSNTTTTAYTHISLFSHLGQMTAGKWIEWKNASTDTPTDWKCFEEFGVHTIRDFNDIVWYTHTVTWRP